MNRETIKNLESFRKLAIPKVESSDQEDLSDGELKVHLSYQSRSSRFESVKKK